MTPAPDADGFGEGVEAQRPEVEVELDPATGDPAVITFLGAPVVPTIECPRCRRASASPEDVAAGYCGACHDWTSPPRHLYVTAFVNEAPPADAADVARHGAEVAAYETRGTPVRARACWSRIVAYLVERADDEAARRREGRL